MGHTKNFFKHKKSWSLIKDNIITWYLKPYIYKILRTGKPATIIDCFAGKGKFDDGKIGSPIIIADQIKAIIEDNPNHSKSLNAIFIEKKYYKDLEININDYINCKLYSGSFEDNINNLLNLSNNRNIFLYIDPYGIKSLDFINFRKIKNRQFNSIEMLLNFNSFGFLREGCRLLKFEGPFDEDTSDYEIDDEANNIENMNQIAYGEYWQNIITEYKNNNLTMHEAERIFSSEYCQKLKQLFKFVINIPIKTSSNNLPKYRLIHGCNHPDGLILMVENMNKRWKELVEYNRNGQQVLFENDFPEFPDDNITAPINDSIMEILKTHGNPIKLIDLIIMLIEKYNISYCEKDYKDKIKFLELSNLIEVNRIPSLTEKGKPVKSFDYKEYKIEVKLK